MIRAPEDKVQLVPGRKSSESAARQDRRARPWSPRGIEASLAEAQRIARLGNWDWNIRGNELWWSDEIYRIFGLTPQEFGATYEAFLQSVHPDDRGLVEEGVRRALEQDESYNIDHRIILPDGSERIVHEQAEIFRDSEGRAIRMIGTVQDITERKSLERIGARRQEALESIYNLATSIETSFATACDQLVASLARLLDVPHVVARSWTGRQVSILAWLADGEIRHEGSTDIACGPCGAILRRKEACQYAGDLKRRFPESLCIASNDLRAYLGVPVRSSAGEVIGILCVMDYAQRTFDLHEIQLVEIFARYLAYEIEHVRMDAELQHAQRLEVLGRLASGVAHEVRNPLNAILAISEALHEDLAADPEYSEYLTQIRIQVDRLAKLMQELLDLGKPVRPADMALASLAAVCRAAVDLWTRTGAHPGHRALVVPRESEDLPVRCDRTKIQQVILNLLDNAAQHSPPEEEIRVVLSGAPGLARVAVVDQGTGIAPHESEKIFEPFFTKRRGGTGLGLSIVRHIVELHGGRVWARNNDPPPGCSVAITLPLGSSE